MNIKTLLLSIIAAASTLSATASAAPITWNLQGVTFADGGTATGSLVIDSDTNQATSWNITTTAGSSLGGFHYTEASSLRFGTGTDYFFAPHSLSNYLKFNTTGLLTSPGSFALITGSSWECNNCSPYRYVSGGSLVSQENGQVPEPAPLALIGIGLAALGARRRLTK